MIQDREGPVVVFTANAINGITTIEYRVEIQNSCMMDRVRYADVYDAEGAEVRTEAVAWQGGASEGVYPLARMQTDRTAPLWCIMLDGLFFRLHCVPNSTALQDIVWNDLVLELYSKHVDEWSHLDVAITRICRTLAFSAAFHALRRRRRRSLEANEFEETTPF